jgi:hypothetical protein
VASGEFIGCEDQVHKSRIPGRPGNYIFYGGADICGSVVWSLLYVTIVAPQML